MEDKKREGSKDDWEEKIREWSMKREKEGRKDEKRKGKKGG